MSAAKSRPLDSHEHEPVRCTARQLLVFGESDDAEAVEQFCAEADNYLAIFAAPTRVDDQTVCFHCGSPLDSFKQVIGIAAAIEWGLVHGEGRCSGMPHLDRPCGWPYRGMHYPKKADGSDLFTMRNTFLAYMPDQVSERKAERAA